MKFYARAGNGRRAGVRIKQCACDRITLDAGVRCAMLRVPISGNGSLDVNLWTFVASLRIDTRL